MTETTGGLATALALFQSKLPEIEKGRTAKVASEKRSYQYDYADLSDVTRVVVPMLADCGLAWITKPTVTPDGKFVLAYRLVHGASGEFEAGEYPLKTGATPQALGSEITYARRYCLLAVTGVAPAGDDDDAAAASAAGRPRTAQRRPTPARQNPASPAAGQRTAQRAQQPAAPPPLPGEDGYDQPTEPATPGITKAQQTKLHATFGDLNVSDRAAKLRIAVEIVGRPLTSSTDLTKDEATGLIDTLSQMTPETVLALIEDDGPTDDDVAALNAEAAEQAAQNADR